MRTWAERVGDVAVTTLPLSASSSFILPYLHA